MKEVSEAKVFFWPYDIFGYLIPGSVVTGSIVYFDPAASNAFSRPYNENWPQLVAFVFISYVTGHLIAAASSQTIERILVKILWGYPAEQMLGHQTFFYRSKYLAYILDMFPPSCGKFSDGYRTRINDLYCKTFSINQPEALIAGNSKEVFWTANDYLMQNATAAYQHILHFVELYGLCRNGSFAFLFVGILCECRGWPAQKILTLESTTRSGTLLTCAFIFAGLALFINYCKLFRKHNESVLRTFVAIAGAAEKPAQEAKDNGNN